MPTSEIDRDASVRDAYARVASLGQRFREELTRLLGDPPDVGNVPEEFWRRVEEEYRREILLMLMLAFLDESLAGGMAQAQAEREAASWAGNLIGDLAPSLVKTGRDRLARIATAQPDEVDDIIDSVFGSDRAETIATTEIARASSAGARAAADASRVTTTDLVWRLGEREQHCPVCLSLDGTGRAHWSRVAPSGPPIHPRCGCWLERI